MRKLITTVMVAVLLASGAAAPAFAGYRYKQHGFGYGYSNYGGHYYKYRPYYRYGYGHRYNYRHYGRRHGYYYFHGDAAVVLGVLAGAVVLGALLSRPSPAPAYTPAVLRSPTGAPLGGCLRTTGTGTWNGRPAQFSGTMCYDSAGRVYVLPGSERFVGYLR